MAAVRLMKDIPVQRNYDALWPHGGGGDGGVRNAHMPGAGGWPQPIPTIIFAGRLVRSWMRAQTIKGRNGPVGEAELAACRSLIKPVGGRKAAVDLQDHRCGID